MDQIYRLLDREAEEDVDPVSVHGVEPDVVRLFRVHILKSQENVALWSDQERAGS